MSTERTDAGITRRKWAAAHGFYLINRETYRLPRVRAAWDAAKLTWRCRNV